MYDNPFSRTRRCPRHRKSSGGKLEYYLSGHSAEKLSRQLDVKKREKIWKQAVVNQPLYVAEMDGEIVGFAIGGENRDKDTYPEFDGELYAIYSYQCVHGRGIGRALFESTARNLAERGYKKMVVSVLAENPAVNFYKYMGGYYLGEETITIDGVSIQESFYGYDDINNI